DQASLLGHVDVTFSGDIASLGEIHSVTVGEAAAYQLRATAGSLTVRLQGNPRPGRADVVVEGSRGRAVRHGLVAYDPPPRGVPLDWMAFGAALTQPRSRAASIRTRRSPASPASWRALSASTWDCRCSRPAS